MYSNGGAIVETMRRTSSRAAARKCRFGKSTSMREKSPEPLVFQVIDNTDGSVCYVSDGSPQSQATPCATLPIMEAAEPQKIRNGKIARCLQHSFSAAVREKLSNGQREELILTESACRFCGKVFTAQTHLLEHESRCEKRPHVVTKPCSDRPEVHVVEFMGALSLVPIAKACKLRKQQTRQQMHLDISNVNVSYPKPTKTPPPMSPRSLFYKIETPLKRNVSHDGEDNDEDNSDESDCPVATNLSLLKIDLTSHLGQKISKSLRPPAVKVDSHGDVTMPQDYDSYCHTPTKDSFVSKLRTKCVDYPVTFRRVRKHCSDYYTYKFTNKDRREWYMTNETGLNKQSRSLKRSMRKCSVSLLRLHKKDISEWYKMKPVLAVDIMPLTPQQIRHWTSPKKQNTNVRGAMDQLRDVVVAPYMFNCAVKPAAAATQCMPRSTPTTCSPSMAFIHAPSNKQLIQLPSSVSSVALSKTVSSPSLPVANSGASTTILLSVLSAKQMTSATLTNGSSRRKVLPLSCLSNSDSANRQDGNSAVFTHEKPSVRRCTNVNVPVEAAAVSAKGDVAMCPTGQQALIATKASQLVSRKRNVSVYDDDDVMMISSDEEGSQNVPMNNAKRPSNKQVRSSLSAPDNRRRSANNNVQSIFTCHICGKVIPCKQGMTNMVGEHFAKDHGVRDIQLLQHVDANGHKVATVIQCSAAMTPADINRYITTCESLNKNSHSASSLFPRQPQVNGRTIIQARRRSSNMGIHTRSALKAGLPRRLSDVICLD